MTAPMDAKLCRELIEKITATSYHKPGSNTRGLDLDKVIAIIDSTPPETPSPEVDDKKIRDKILEAYHSLSVSEYPGSERVDKIFEAIRPYLAQGAVPQPEVDGFNGCLHVAKEALTYLAENKRPSGGQERFNSEHLHQLSKEIGITQKGLAQGAVRVSLKDCVIAAAEADNPTRGLYPIEEAPLSGYMASTKAVILSLKQQNPGVQFYERD